MKFQILRNIYHFVESWFWIFWYGYPAKNLIVIGVTGTDGKTTTCHLIYEILKKAGKKVALISTVAAYIGDEEIDTGFHVTTANAKVLQPLLKKIVDRGMTHVVLEVTSHALDQNRVVGCNFYTGVITNITHEHLDYHGTMERYRAAKMKLLAMSKHPIYEYSKTKLKITNSKLYGDYNLYNISAATAVAEVLGIRDSVIGIVIKDFPGVPGRMEEVPNKLGIKIIVDFAHTPNALKNVLSNLSNPILVFGCAGLRDHTKRPMMGEIAVKYADKVIITAEDPRTEKLDDIYKQVVLGIRDSVLGIVTREDDREKAIKLAISMAKKGDTVVITGKGHEKSMCFGTTEYPWSDRDAVQKAL